MAFDINAIKAAAAKLQQQEDNAQPKSELKRKRTTATKASASTKKAASKQPKTDTHKQECDVSYVIPAEFKAAIENYLFSRPDMAEKMAQEGKSMDGCCEYIFNVMKARAEKARNGKSCVGVYSKPDEVFGLAVHYYDESDEDLKKELEEKE